MMEIDLHGMLKEEARIHLNAFLKECIIKKKKYAKIIHGNGKFILKELVDSTLKENPNVKLFYMGHPSLGGSGITIVEFI